VLEQHARLADERLRGVEISARTRWLITHHHEAIDDPDLHFFQAADGGESRI